MSTSGEVSSITYAEHLLKLIEDQNDAGLIKFLKNLSLNYDIDTKRLIKDAKIYSSEKNEQNLGNIKPPLNRDG